MVKDSNALDLEELLEYDLKLEGLESMFDIVARYSWWVSPKVYAEVQVVYPGTRRKKGIRERRGEVRDGVRLWDNQPASHAFWAALGEDVRKVKNFYVCHIYEGSVWDPMHFTNLANLTAFPKCLQSLSEWKPVRDLLKFHSFESFGYKGPSGLEPAESDHYRRIWQHQVDPSSRVLAGIVKKLKGQMTNRPQFKKDEELSSRMEGTV